MSIMCVKILNFLYLEITSEQQPTHWFCSKQWVNVFIMLNESLGTVYIEAIIYIHVVLYVVSDKKQASELIA